MPVYLRSYDTQEDPDKHTLEENLKIKEEKSKKEREAAFEAAQAKS